MDPALQELIRPQLDADELLEVVVRLRRAGRVPRGIHGVAHFGEIVTGRVRRRDIERVYASPRLLSLKAARSVRPARHRCFGDEEGRAMPRVGRRSGGGSALGKGVVVAVLDWGFDFAHREFLKPDGSTRLLALWNQAARYRPARPNRYGYGRIVSHTEIDRALATRTPYRTLGYHPGRSPAHATHVASIAAGSRIGQAPESDLIFVHLSTSDVRPEQHLGDSVRLLEALDFCRRVAKDRPLVVNMSLGRHGGPKDGTSLVVRAVDEFIRSRPSTMVCQSAGNYYRARAHHSGIVYPGRSSKFTFLVQPDDPTDNELEVWYSGRDVFRLRLTHLASGKTINPGLGQREELVIGRRNIGRLYHRRKDPNNGKNHINLFLDAAAPSGRYLVELYGDRVVDGNYHAYLERDGSFANSQTRFLRRNTDTKRTIGSLAASRHAIVVGAYRPGRRPRHANFSSGGPSLDGRRKPDLLAPGVAIRGAASVSRGRGAPDHRYVRESGTSMAAPFVAGSCARLLGILPAGSDFYTLRRLMLGGADHIPRNFDADRSGAGIVNPGRSLALARKVR